MAVALGVKQIEDLYQFCNKQGIMEIALRDKRKKFTAFQKVVFKDFKQGEQREVLQKVIKQLNKNLKLNEKSLNMLNNVAKLQQLNVLLSGLNLCATCAGFAIMYAKLDKISGQINQLMNVVKQGQEVQADFEFKKVIAEHSNMLDCRKTQKFYTEEQMRKLVDDEYNVLSMLIDVFVKDLAVDKENLVFSIYSLASMLAVSMKYFDEIYFINNREAIGDGDKWHSSHDNWMSVFDKLKEDAFIERIQDYAMFDMNLSVTEADAFYISLRDQADALAEDVRDNQTLVEKLFDSDMLVAYREAVDKEVSEEIKEAFTQIDGAMEDPEVVKTYQDAMRQMALGA